MTVSPIARKGASRIPGPAECRRKFLRFFPAGFADATYHAWERDYKWRAHEQWQQELPKAEFARLLRAGEFREIAARAVRIESRTNLLFSFEKMALRDAVKPAQGAERFGRGLFAFLHGGGLAATRFARWCAVLGALPRRQTRVLTWPVATVLGFIAQPERQIFLKPMVTRRAAAAYGFDFPYAPRPSAVTYAAMLKFAAVLRADLRDLKPRDMIDIQSFIWVLGSDEYD
jgi:hypothetical protein